MNTISDPRTLLQSQEPFLIFCNQENLIGDVIDFRTHIKKVLPWDHAMLSINAGKFVSQSMGIFNAYKEIPMADYMVSKTTLAFIQLCNSTPAFVTAFRASVQARLAAPWWVTQYDFLGIFGQAIGCPWIHTPGLEYCSVDVIRHLVNACPNLPKSDQLIINAIPRETNPEMLWQIVLNNPATFSLYGVYNSARGIIV